MSNRRPKRNNRKNLKKFDKALLTPSTQVDRFTWRANGLRITLNPTKGYFVSKDYYTSINQSVDASKELEKALEEKAMSSVVTTNSSAVTNEAELTQTQE